MATLQQTLQKKIWHLGRENKGIKSPASLNPPIPWRVYHIAKRNSLVLNSFDEKHLQRRHKQSLAPEEEVVPRLPNYMTKGPKGKSGNTMRKLIAGERFDGPL